MASAEGDYLHISAAGEVFLSGGDGVAMLDEDQMEFEKDNLFNQGDATNGLESSCLSLPDSWSLRSHLTLSPSSFMGSMEDSVRDCLRVSIGSFIASKTEALGSLGAEGTSERPTFGTEFSTPPRNRKPLPLMDLVCESDGSDAEDTYLLPDSDIYSSSMDETLTDRNTIIPPKSTDVNPSQHNYQELSASVKPKDATNGVDIETGNDDLVQSSGGTSVGTRTAVRNRVRPPAFVQPLDVIVEVPSERNSSASSSRITNEMEKWRESSGSNERSRNVNDEDHEIRTDKTGAGKERCSINEDMPGSALDGAVRRPVVGKSVMEKEGFQSTLESGLNLQTPMNDPSYYSGSRYFKQHPEFYSLKVDNSRTLSNRTGEYTQELAVGLDSCSSATRTAYEPRDPAVDRTTDFRSLMLSSSSYITPGIQPSKHKDKRVEQLRLGDSQKPSRASVEQELILSRIKAMAANGELGTKFRSATNAASNQRSCSKDAAVQKHGNTLPRDKRRRNKENVDPERVKDRPAVISTPLTDSNRNGGSVGNSEGDDISWKSPRKTPKRVGSSSDVNSEGRLLSTTSVILSTKNTLNAGATASLNPSEPAAVAGDKMLHPGVGNNGDDDTLSFCSTQTNFSEMFMGLPPKLLRDLQTGKRTAGPFQVFPSEGGLDRDGVGCDRGISPGAELEQLSTGPITDSSDGPMASPFEAVDNYKETIYPVARKEKHPTVSDLFGLNKISVASSSLTAQSRQKMNAFRTNVVPCTITSKWNGANQPPASVANMESYLSERINAHYTLAESVLTVNDKLHTTAVHVSDKECDTSSRANKLKSNTSKTNDTKSTPPVNLPNNSVSTDNATSVQSAVLLSSVASIRMPTMQPDTTSSQSATSVQVAASLQSAIALPCATSESSSVRQCMTSLVPPRTSKKQSKDKSCQNFAMDRFLSEENHSVHDLSKHLPQNTQALPHSSKGQMTLDLSSSSLSGQSSSTTPLTSGIVSGNLPSKRVAGPQFEMVTNYVVQLLPEKLRSLNDLMKRKAKTSAKKSLIVPLEVRIRDVCCVGLSAQDTLHVENPSENWVKVTFEVTRVTVDDKPMNDCFSCPFSVKNKTLIEPKNSEEIKIIFVPRVSGVFVAQLHLHSIPVSADELATQSSSKLPIMVTLQAIAEKPSIQVTAAGGGSNLHVGPIPWGNHSSGTVCLINRGRANIPVRLAISSISSNCCFSFEKQSESQTSKIPSKRHPLTSLIYSCMLPSMDVTGCLKPVAVPIHFVAPDRQYGSVEEFRGRVVAEVDAISTSFHLGIVELTGKAGTAKIHVPRDMNELKFVAGQQDVFSVPMLNAGNICIMVGLQVSMSCDMFEVSPKEFILEPAQEKNISIKFKPTLDSAAAKVTSILLIMVRPDGPFYKIRLFGLRGKSVENPPGKSLGHHMEGFSMEEGITDQMINYQAMQEGFINHLKDHSNRTRLGKAVNGESKWDDVASHGKQKSQSNEVGNRMTVASEQQNAVNLKEILSKALADDVIASKQHLSVKLHHSKDRDTHIHTIPERDVPIAFLTSISPTCNATINPSTIAMTHNGAAVWTVKPERITLPSSCATLNCEPVIKRIQIINYTKHSMPFKLTWPEKFITVTPEHGNVLPRSSTVICISANIGLQQKGLHLPWCGDIRILSESESKHVSVKIIAEGECTIPPRHENDIEVVQSELDQCDDRLIGSVTIPNAEIGDETGTSSKHQRLNFQPTVTKDTVERVLAISNLSGLHLKWSMTAFAPVYIKKPGQSCCRRLLYSVFWLPLQSGFLHPGGQVEVVICFCPREVGFYSQFWEVVFESSELRKDVSQISRIELFASSVTETRDCGSVTQSNCSYCDKPMLCANSTDSDESTSSPCSLEVPSRDSLISVMPLEINFPVSAVNKKSTVKVVMKNRDSKPYMMEITEPDKPFYTRHRKLKLESRHYLSVPFDFLPKAKGYYESKLLLKSDSGHAFTVTLSGTCE